MPVISYKTFDGEIPKWAADLLPNGNAQLATNCDFGDGKLRPMKDGALLQTMVNNPVKGIYTDDGLLFYTWAAETLAFKSPIIDDAFDRVYYLTPSVGQFRVALRSGMAFNGPSPATSWKVGVPKPTVAPTLRTADRTTLPDYPSAVFAATAWWDYAGTKYSEGAVALTTVTALRKFTFAQPALPGSPPAGVAPTLYVQIKVTDPTNSNALLMDVTVRAGTTARSQAFPGTLEIGMAVASSGVANIDLVWGAVGSRAYVYVNENTWNEEGAPSPPATISPNYVQDVVITPTLEDFTGYRPFLNYNFYRTYGTTPTYVRTDVTGTGPFTDASTRPSSVGIALQSTDWFPPVAGLAGLELMPGGWFVSFKDNILYKHAPYRPHAVPYEESFPTNIRGVRVGQSGLVVTCASGVFVVPGLSPQQDGYVPLSAPQPGVSQRSMTNLDGAVAFVSHDGLPMVAGSMASMDASQKLFTRKKWRERYGDIIDDFSIRLACYDGMLLATSSTQSKGFILRLDEDAGAFSRIEQRMEATFRLPVTDALYYSVGANVYQFQGGTDLTYDWWSKDFIFTKEVSFGAGHLIAAGSVTLKIYVDDVLWETKTLTTGPFRIAPIKAKKWSLRLSGTAEVSQLEMAQSFQELKGV